MTVFIRFEKNPDMVEKFERVIALDKYEDGRVILTYGVRNLLRFKDIISVEIN